MESPSLSLLTCIVTLCGMILPGQENTAIPHDVNSELSETHAYIRDVVAQDAEHAELLLDFVGIFYEGKKEYQRYLTAGYPDIGFSQYESATAGGTGIFNQQTTLRELTTTVDTVYEGYCTESPYKDADGIVQLNQQEFMAIQNKDSVNSDVWQTLNQKHGHCISQNQNLVKITYSPSQEISKISLIWSP